MGSSVGPGWGATGPLIQQTRPAADYGRAKAPTQGISADWPGFRSAWAAAGEKNCRRKALTRKRLRRRGLVFRARRGRFVLVVASGGVEARLVAYRRSGLADGRRTGPPSPRRPA